PRETPKATPPLGAAPHRPRKPHRGMSHETPAHALPPRQTPLARDDTNPASFPGACHELLESRVALQRVEVRVDAEPGGCEVVITLEKRLQMVERLALVAREQVNARKQVLTIGPLSHVFFRAQFQSLLPFADRLVLASQEGQRETSERVGFCVRRVGVDVLLE